MEGVRFAVGTDVPTLGDIGLNLEIFVEPDEPGEDLDDVERRAHVLRDRRIEEQRVIAAQPKLARCG